MAIISDLGGTTQNSFSINGKFTLYQIDGNIEPNEMMGKNGDLCSNEIGSLFIKQDNCWKNLVATQSLPIPSHHPYEMIFSNGSEFVCSENIKFENNELKLNSSSISTSNNDNESKLILSSNNSKIEIISTNTDNYATAPTPNENAINNEIITAEWIKNNIKDDLDDKVSISKNETITGSKTFSGLGTFTNYNTFWKAPYNIIVRSTSIENGVTPISNQYMGIEFRDKNDVRVGWIGLATKTDGTQQIELQKFGSTSGFAVPTPPAGDNSDQISTTSFVQTAISNTAVTTVAIGTNYVKLSNGLIIQWGDYGKTAGTITLPTPFTSTNYQIAIANTESGHEYSPSVGNKTTTSFDWFTPRMGSWIAIGF